MGSFEKNLKETFTYYFTLFKLKLFLVCKIWFFCFLESMCRNICFSN